MTLSLLAGSKIHFLVVKVYFTLHFVGQELFTFNPYLSVDWQIESSLQRPEMAETVKTKEVYWADWEVCLMEIADFKFYAYSISCHFK